MNSKKIGNITEVECMLAFMKLGYNVLQPYGDCERYDFVADITENFIKYNVKLPELMMMVLLLNLVVEVLIEQKVNV